MSDKEGSPRLRSRSRSPSIEDDGSRYAMKEKRSRTRSRSRSKSRGAARAYYSRSRSRSRSRRRHSRSRSRSPYHGRRRSHKHSRSRSYSPRYRNDRSTSPLSRRRRHIGSRDRPKTSRCLGVFGLSLYTTEREVKDVIGRYGPIEDINLVHDHQTGRSRGFAFIYMRNLDDAVECKERAPGTEIDGHKIRVDYSITERAHTPTPGVYLGRPTSRGYYNRSDRNSRRSPSPHYRSRGSRYSRSRSRSRSYGK